jgi:hypothetical protein
MKSNRLERDILRWEYENETKGMYSPPSYIEWLEDKLIELRKHAVSNCYTLQDMIDAYDAGVWNPNDETAKEYMKRKYNVC